MSNMVPEWPDFKKLTLDDQATIKSLTSDFPPYSDFNFVSMWTYNVLDESEWSILNDNLVVKFQSYTSDDFFYSFLGTNRPLATVKTLLERSKELGLSDKLSLVPEVSLRSVGVGSPDPPRLVEAGPSAPSVNGRGNPAPTSGNPDGSEHSERSTHATERSFVVGDDRCVVPFATEDRDNFDYIFDTEAISSLAGPKFGKERNLVRLFQKTVVNYEVKLVDICQNDTANEVTKLFRTWEKSRGKSEEHEFTAIARLLRDAKNFEGLVSLGIYINGQLEAWGISEIVGNGYGVAHYRKANANWPGIFTVLEQEIAKELVKRNVKFLNFEQDLGLPGLRHSKEGWRPVAFLKKYSIS